LIQRYEEQPLVLALIQQSAAVGIADQAVAQLRAEALEYRGVQQKFLQLACLPRNDVFGEEVRYLAALAACTLEQLKRFRIGTQRHAHNFKPTIQPSLRS